MARASVAAGADGLIVEVHCNPDKALSDGAQSMYPAQFDRVMAELDSHHKRSLYRADDDLVFCHPHIGTPLDRARLLKRFKAAARRAALRPVRFHDLRHTFGTRMAAARVPMRTLQEWMGHRDIKTTQIYADYAPSSHEREFVERAFGGGSAHRRVTSVAQ